MWARPRILAAAAVIATAAANIEVPGEVEVEVQVVVAVLSAPAAVASANRSTGGGSAEPTARDPGKRGGCVKAGGAEVGCQADGPRASLFGLGHNPQVPRPGFLWPFGYVRSWGKNTCAKTSPRKGFSTGGASKHVLVLFLGSMLHCGGGKGPP